MTEEKVFSALMFLKECLCQMPFILYVSVNMDIARQIIDPALLKIYPTCFFSPAGNLKIHLHHWLLPEDQSSPFSCPTTVWTLRNLCCDCDIKPLIQVTPRGWPCWTCQQEKCFLAGLCWEGRQRADVSRSSPGASSRKMKEEQRGLSVDLPRRADGRPYSGEDKLPS